MKKICSIFLCFLLCQNNIFAYSQIDISKTNIMNSTFQKNSQKYVLNNNTFSYSITDAITIPKGTLFHTKCDNEIISGNYKYDDIHFISGDIFLKNNLQNNVIFRGKITKNHAPRLCSSGEVKIKITRIIVDGIAYPVKATIKMADNKKVFGGIISGDSLYPQNVREAAALGNSYINRNSVDPCNGYCDAEHPVKATLNLTKGAIISASSVVAAPIIGFFGKGNNVNIKKMSDFIIKLNEDVNVAIPSCNYVRNTACNTNKANIFIY